MLALVLAVVLVAAPAAPKRRGASPSAASKLKTKAAPVVAPPEATITFAPAQALLDACPGEQTFTGLANGTLQNGTAFDLTSASFDVKRPAPSTVELVVTGSGTVAGREVNELSFSDRIGDGEGDDGPLSSVYAVLASPHALAVWLGGRAMVVGKKHALPTDVLRALGARKGTVTVEQAKSGARLKLNVVAGGDVRSVQSELLVDPATWLVKSVKVDVHGRVNGHARAFGVCRS